MFLPYNHRSALCCINIQWFLLQVRTESPAQTYWDNVEEFHLFTHYQVCCLIWTDRSDDQENLIQWKREDSKK